jgi:transcription elongation factor SPT5
MSNFLNQDFGSDEEDDDFNPAPAEESDVEDAKVSSRLYGMVRRDVTDKATMKSPRKDARAPKMPLMT